MAPLPTFRIIASSGVSGITIKLAGELDSAACLELLERFEEVAAAPNAQHVLLDLAEVSFVDSAGMRAIIVIERSAAERGLALTMSPPPAPVTELLQIRGVAGRVPLASAADEAPPSGPFIERIDLELPRDRRAPGWARAELRSAVRGHIADADCATLTLLTSELVTNAVIHPAPAVQGSIEFRITTYADRVRVEVGDAGSGFDLASLPPRPRESGGHGLIVVEGLASRWGTRRRPSEAGGGFCVWFELDTAYALEGAEDAAVRPERSVATAEG